MNLTRRKFLLASGGAAIAAPGVASLAASARGVETEVARDKSLWLVQAPAQHKFKPLTQSLNADLVVIGGGYTGLSCAYYAKLQRPDWRVIVIDSHEIGSGASSRNTGAVYAKQQGIANQAFAERGLSRLLGFIEQHEIDCDLVPASTLMLTTSKSEAKKAKRNLLVGETWVAKDELNQRISSPYYSGAVDTPNFYKIQPAKLVAGHLQAALDIGVECYENTPAMNVAHGKVVRVETPSGQLNAKQVMIATNAYTPRLGIKNTKMFPLHQYSLATRKLDSSEIQSLGLDRWTMRFERNVLPVTFSITPTGHFFLRMVLGYASHDSEVWQDSSGAKAIAQKLFAQRYPSIRDLEPETAWHGVTGHTPFFKPIAGVLGQGNVHISVAYNGLGIMPGHNSGYLSACRITGMQDPDLNILTSASSMMPFPGDFYRSMMLKPVMNLLRPV